MTVAQVLAGEARWHVEQGDCLDVLRAMPDASVDAVVTDPPYELGFMGKAWDASGIAYRVDLWREVLRVLKPGGHLLAFGGTRTYHRMTCAIEDAGMEIRDSIHWMFGSGFPKSLDVSKAIDREAGAARPVVGTRRLTGTARIVGGQGGATSGRSAEMYETHATRDELDLTAPATPLAEQWDGWGTALKPAHEPCVLARKPLIGTVAANVAEYGTGAVNVDACRIHSGPSAGGTNGGRMGFHGANGTCEIDRALSAGRFPANVVLSHLPECREVGVRRVRTGDPTRADGTVRSGPRSVYAFGSGATVGGYASPDGTETVPAYDCAPGCAVAALDEQSGERPASYRKARTGNMSREQLGGLADDGAPFGHHDTGGASRFYYVAKASRAERNAGCEGLPYTWTPGAEPRTNRSGETRPIPGTTSTSGNTTPNRGNVHPTVKPLALMRWLARLVTPPGGVVLDPFTGSGSTGCACALEGFRFVGIEREPEYVEIARARIAHWEEQATAPAKPKRAPKPRPAPPPPSSPRPVADERQLDLLARLA